MKPHDMGTLFDEVAERGTTTITCLSRPFDIAPEGGVSYPGERLAELVRTAAGWFTAAGVRRGDRVAIVKDNHWDYDLLACAAVRIGALPAQLSAHLPPDTLQILLTRLEPALLVSTAEILTAARRTQTDLAGLVRRTLSLDEPVPGAVHLDDVRGERPPGARRRGDDEPLIVNHTSGTTGVPKLVVHSTATIIRRLARFEAVRWPLIGVRRTDTVASASSFAHGRTFCWTASVFCLAPEKVLIVADLDARSAQAVLQAHPPTTLEALPAAYVQWQPLTEGPDNPFRAVRMFVSTYDAMHPATMRAYLAASRRRRPIWMQGWGQTETGPLTFRFLTRRSLAAAAQRHPTTRNLGRPVPLRTKLRVVDPDSFQPLPRGRQGLVLARTKARCLGYVGEPERFAGKVDGPWWNTGDVGVRTRGGNVLFLDREVDLVPQLSCVEVEDVLDDRLPGLLDCVILGAAGRPPLPVVVTEDGRLDETAWQDATADLPPLADPVVLTWDEVPRTGTGKVRRLELRALLLGDVPSHRSGRWT
ncbi:MAG TPA: AMP-binding protein [Pseudonocardiaceae bacterium]|nr:AMP-binding protein [Pseudonocardiaceae bacterium]